MLRELGIFEAEAGLGGVYSHFGQPRSRVRVVEAGWHGLSCCSTCAPPTLERAASDSSPCELARAYKFIRVTTTALGLALPALFEIL